VSVSPQNVQDLRVKYIEMLAMRLAHEDGSESDPQARARMAALAARFPGALREIDRIELIELRARIARLEAVLAGECEGESWMAAIALFHELMRGALCAKRWLNGEKRVADSTARAFASELSSLEFPDEARAWVNRLEGIAAPPRGRITELVYARIAVALGIPLKEARRLVFGTGSGRTAAGRTSST
jgi:hypothetical protein